MLDQQCVKAVSQALRVTKLADLGISGIPLEVASTLLQLFSESGDNGLARNEDLLCLVRISNQNSSRGNLAIVVSTAEWMPCKKAVILQLIAGVWLRKHGNRIALCFYLLVHYHFTEY